MVLTTVIDSARPDTEAAANEAGVGIVAGAGAGAVGRRFGFVKHHYLKGGSDVHAVVVSDCCIDSWSGTENEQRSLESWRTIQCGEEILTLHCLWGEQRLLQQRLERVERRQFGKRSRHK